MENDDIKKWYRVIYYLLLLLLFTIYYLLFTIFVFETPCQCLIVCFDTGSPTVPFAAFLHLIRGYLQSIKQKQMQREEAALRQLRECKMSKMTGQKGILEQDPWVSWYVCVYRNIYMYTHVSHGHDCVHVYHGWMSEIARIQVKTLIRFGTKEPDEQCKKPCFVWGMSGIILPNYIGTIINHYKDPY